MRVRTARRAGSAVLSQESVLCSYDDVTGEVMADPIRLIDLFAGIGGIRLGFEQAARDLSLDVECVFSSEWDRFAQDTYEGNFGERPFGDITEDEVQERIPDFDVMLAGFPCQPFSLAGVSKKNSLGLPHGFKDPTQGTLFHEIVKIIEAHQPAAFLLENVKHLRRHDKGRTFAVITDALDALGYRWQADVINASTRVPQNRERIYIIGVREDLPVTPVVPYLEPEPVAVRDILHEHRDGGEVSKAHWDRSPGSLEKYELSNHLWQYLQAYAAKHRAAGNGFGFGLLEDLDGITRTLSARYHKDGSEILIPQEGRNPRRLTPRECARLQGYPEDFRIVCSDTQAYRQFGNSVAVPVIREIAAELLRDLSGVLTKDLTAAVA